MKIKYLENKELYGSNFVTFCLMYVLAASPVRVDQSTSTRDSPPADDSPATDDSDSDSPPPGMLVRF